MTAETTGTATDVAVAEVPRLTQLSLRLDPDGPAAASVAKLLGTGLPTTPCTWVQAGPVDLLWLGPDEWLLLAAPDADGLRPDLVQAIATDFGTVTDVSAQRTAFDLTGPDVREVLARGCAIDLHLRAAPVGTCVQTLLAQAGVVLTVRATAPPAVRLLVRSSYAPYLLSWLGDAVSGR